MYKIIGADGKEYGPITLEQLTDWVRQGRVNPQTRVQAPASSDWKQAADLPELQPILGQMRASAPPPIEASTSTSAEPPKKSLAIVSLILGIVAVACLGPFAGIPAIICGHLAHNRARRSPGQFGGAGIAVAGFVTGYIGLVLGVFMIAVYSAMLLPALSKAKGRAQEINCVNNMKQIGLAFKIWAMDHQDQFPFNVSTNTGGTLELCAPGPDGYDKNAALHFLVLSNELSTPKILVCPSDSKQAAPAWSDLGAANVSYLVRSGPSVTDTNPQTVLAICPIHNHKLFADGSVHRGNIAPSRSR